MSSDAELRASDQDRDRCAAHLADHLVAGRLTMVEFEDRTARAYAATTLSDLQALASDLPVAVRATAGRYVRQAGPEAASDAAASGGSAWATWAVSNLVCVVIWAVACAVQGQLLGFWPIWVIGPWGAVLLVSTAVRRLGGGDRLGAST